MREPLSNKEILALFEEKFPYFEGITYQSVAAYRNKYVPSWKLVLAERYGKEKEKTPEILEKEILAVLRETEEDSEEFTKEELQKINQIKAHKQLLKELWQNYANIKGSTDEVAKHRYLKEMSDELELISTLELSEKSFLMALDSVRQAEAKQTIQQHFDSLIGWFIPRAMEKAKSNSEALEYVFRLSLFLNDYSKLLLENPIKTANKILLNKIYAVKKIIKEEK